VTINPDGGDINTQIQGNNIASVIEVDAGTDAARLGAGLSIKYASKTREYTADSADHMIVATEGTWNLNIPDISQSGQEFIVKNMGAGTITLVGGHGQQFDGAANIVLNQYDTATIIANKELEMWMVI
jgi:hypothetical protein